MAVKKGKMIGVRTLAQTWQAWSRGEKILADLGDGSRIRAVGQPRRWVCEVRSERGVEYRQSDEMVVWYEAVEDTCGVGGFERDVPAE